MENFQIKNSDIFHISAQNIDCGYSLEFYDHIKTKYQFIKHFLDKKCLFLRNMEPLNEAL